MNRADLTNAALLYEQLSAAAKEKAQTYRAELQQQAADELATQGMAPTWRLPDIGTVSLPVSSEAVYLADRKALLEYAATRPVEEQAVEAVLEIQAPWLAALERRLVPAGDAVADSATGEVIPGYAVRPGGVPQSLTIRPNAEARAIARQYAEGMLDRFEAALNGDEVA